MHRIAPLAAVVLAAACASAKTKPVAKAAAPAASAAAVAAAPAPAATPAAPAPAAPAMPAKTTKLSAVVSSVDATAGTVTVTSHGAKRVFRVAQGAKLTKGGAMSAIALRDVSEGDRLTVSYAGDVLASLHVKVAPAAGADSSVAKADKTDKAAKKN